MGHRRKSDDEFKVDATFILIQASGLSDAQLGAFMRRACQRWRMGAQPTLSQAYPNPLPTVWDGLDATTIEHLFNSPTTDGAKVCEWLEKQLEDRERFRDQQRAHAQKGVVLKRLKAKAKKPTLSQPSANPETAPAQATPAAPEKAPVPADLSTQKPAGLSTAPPTSAPIRERSSVTVTEEEKEKSRVQPSSVVGATEKKSDFTKANLPIRKQQFIDHCTAVNTEKKILEPAELARFLNHFTMHNADGFKMLFEIQRTKRGVWSAPGHMVTWRDRNKQWNADRAVKAGGSLPVSNADEFDESI